MALPTTIELQIVTPDKLVLRENVDEVEQGGKGGAQIHAPPAPVADVEDPLELLLDLRRIVEIRILPVERMPRRSFERALPCGHC